MHDLLFQNANALQREDLRGYARQLGLDMARFETALDSPETSARVERDLAEARRVGASGTPTFFVDGRRLGNHQEATFRKTLQRAIRQAAADGS